MYAAGEIIEQATALGVELTAVSAGLSCLSTGPLPEALRSRLHRHKPAILVLLKQRDQERSLLAGLTDDEGERFRERVSIMTVDGRVHPDDALTWAMNEILADRAREVTPIP